MQLNDQTVLFNQELPLNFRVHLETMATNGYSSFSEAPGQKPHHQMFSCHIFPVRYLLWGRGEGLTLPQRCNRCILQPQLTGLVRTRVIR